MHNYNTGTNKNMNKSKVTKITDLLLELWAVPNEKRTDEIFEEMNRLSPDPEWSNYLFHSEEFVGTGDVLLVEDLVNKILAYKPIIL